ncbi:hypothetical protein ADK43_21910 [Streptomyces rimosus subsp. rimosus]|nr:hypothetical protein ADK43_21910 [Streptomyces rimosus subsp. rimosus]
MNVWLPDGSYPVKAITLTDIAKFQSFWGQEEALRGPFARSDYTVCDRVKGDESATPPSAPTAQPLTGIDGA